MESDRKENEIKKSRFSDCQKFIDEIKREDEEIFYEPDLMS